jgi:pyruvate dehydrogenase E1 component alpha subunit
VNDFGIVPSSVEAIQKEVESEIQEIVRFAQDSPWPSPEEAMEDVFA